MLSLIHISLAKAPGMKLRESGGVGSDMQLMLDGFSGKHVKIFICLLYTSHSCLLCGRQLISGERVLCLKCLSRLPRTQFHLRKDNIVECNFWGKIPVERATSFLYYAKGGNVRQLLYELKYHGNQEVGEVMGQRKSLRTTYFILNRNNL